MQRTEITNKYIRTLGLQMRIPDMLFINDITCRHVAQFAFSSIGPILGDELPLDLESLYRRIVIKRRGGYCFEQNGLMYEILGELGFSVSLYLARVIYNRDIHPGLTHRITLVEIDDSQYVVDVGFGPLGPDRPVNMSGQESVQGFRQFRIVERCPGEFHMQTLRDGGYYSLYKFELARYGQADCEVGHFFSHKHPQASFVNHLVVSNIRENEIRSLRDHEFSLTTKTGEQKSDIGSAAELKTILRTQFDIDINSNEAQYLFAKTTPD